MSVAKAAVRRRTGGLVVGAALLFMCVGASQARAACTSTAPDADGDVVTTCTATGAEQTFTVPSRIVGALQVVAIGGFVFGNNADRAADVRGTIPIGAGGPVQPGDTLYIEVGTPGIAGINGGTGGFNGGGNGGAPSTGGRRGSGGGGATDVRTCARAACPVTGVAATDPRLIVAAGIGGGAGRGDQNTFGGAAGLPSPGADGRVDPDFGGTPGRGATLAAGGSAGHAVSVGAAGVAGQGGGGGPESGGSGGAGGGGGGGFFGGGGGGGGGSTLGTGGGGGSSYAAAALTDVSFAPTTPLNEAPKIEIAYRVPPPETTITSGPGGLGVGDLFLGAGATFSFASDAADATFECRLDAGAWQVCTSPKAYAGVTLGSHTFAVRALDVIGRVDPTPAQRTWFTLGLPL
jgi:hypothetical protein